MAEEAVRFGIFRVQERSHKSRQQKSKLIIADLYDPKLRVEERSNH